MSAPLIFATAASDPPLGMPAAIVVVGFFALLAWMLHCMSR